MRYALIAIFIFGTLLLLGLCAVAKAADTLYYTTNGLSPLNTDVETFIKSQNPLCNEWEKVYLPYDRLKLGDKRNCKRYRTWWCKPTGQEGVDIEHLPLDFCKQDN